MQSRVHVLPFLQVIFSLLEDHLHMFRSEKLGSKVIEDCALRLNEQDFEKSFCFSSFVNGNIFFFKMVIQDKHTKCTIFLCKAIPM